MKKSVFLRLFATVLAIVMVVGSTNAFALTLGDINGDETVNSMDANTLKRVLAGVLTLSGDAFESADVNGDGAVNSLDSNLLSRKVAGKLEPSEPSVPESTDPAIVVESVKAAPGAKTVTVNVSVKNNPGILAMMLSCSYDSSVLTLTGTSNGDALSALSMTKPGKFTSPCNFIWDGVELTADDIKDGTMLTLTFDVAENAQNGTYEIAFSYNAGGIIDNDMQPVEFEITNGSIVVG